MNKMIVLSSKLNENESEVGTTRVLNETRRSSDFYFYTRRFVLRNEIEEVKGIGLESVNSTLR